MLTAGDRGTKKLELREANGIILAQATTQMSLSMDSKLWIYKVWIAWQGSLRCISLILTTCQVQLNLYQTIYISYKWTLFFRWHTHFCRFFIKHNLKGGELDSRLIVSPSCELSNVSTGQIWHHCHFLRWRRNSVPTAKKWVLYCNPGGGNFVAVSTHKMQA